MEVEVELLVDIPTVVSEREPTAVTATLRRAATEALNVAEALTTIQTFDLVTKKFELEELNFFYSSNVIC